MHEFGNKYIVYTFDQFNSYNSKPIHGIAQQGIGMHVFVILRIAFMILSSIDYAIAQIHAVLIGMCFTFR